MPQTIKSLAGDVYDVDEIFGSKAKRPPTPQEVEYLQGVVSPFTNPALGVSRIQQFAQNHVLPSGGTVQGIGTTGTGGNASATLAAVPKTIGSRAEDFKVNKITVDEANRQGIPFAQGLQEEIQGQQQKTPAIEAPQYATALPDTERQQLEQQQASLVADAEARSRQRIEQIKQLGETRKGQARSYLAGRGILGRTITGAPEQTGLGELSSISNKVGQAISEEEDRSRREIAGIKTDVAAQGQQRLEKINALQTQDFENRLKLKGEERLGQAELRNLYKDVYDIAAKIPAGQTMQIGSHTIWGTKEIKPDLDEFKQYDAQTGKLVVGAVDRTTGEMSYLYDLDVGDPKQADRYDTITEGGRIFLRDKFAQDPSKAIIDTGIAIPKAETERNSIRDVPIGGKTHTVLVDERTGAIVKDYGEKQAGGGPGGLTPNQQADLSINIGKMFFNNSKEALKAGRDAKLISIGFEQAKKAGFNGTSRNPASQVVLVMFQRMLDPTSVVRESEYARSGAGQSLMGRIQGTVEKLQFGGAGVTEIELKEFYDVTQELLKGYQAFQIDNARLAREQAKHWEIDLKTVLPPEQISSLVDFDLQESGYDPAEIQELRSSGITDEQFQQILDRGGPSSFNPAGSGAANAQGSVSFRHNNPLNIKYGEFAKTQGATPGQAATDGGQFALFPSAEAGLKAGKQLLTGPNYRNLTVDAAMKRWSNSGYGGDVAPAIRNKKISDLSDQELTDLMRRMQQREGWNVA